MAHVIDVRNISHQELQEEESDESQAETTLGEDHTSPPEPTSQEAPSRSMSSTVVTRFRTSKQAKAVSAVVTILALVAVTLGVALNHGSKESTVEATTGTVTVVPQADEPVPFFGMSVQGDGSATFMLSKAHWNESFMVYPTVVKHSSPPHAGMERGSVLLETDYYVFHFEKSTDNRFLFLVCENHLARLRSDDDQLREAFENSQWPGYFTRIPIYMETEDAYHVPTDPLLAHGFFVSSRLMTPYYTPVRDGSSFFPRNSNLQIEYELDDGVVVVNYAIGLLPETVMAQRVSDDRVGYFTQRFVKYGVDNNDPANSTDEGPPLTDAAVTVINRRRLERDPTTGKTLKPIVYHIDPSVPLKWREAFAAGVTAWIPAFEAIGFKDAIKVVMPGDPDWPEDYRIGDLRYDSISVIISDETYALGPMVYDPRSGEILHSDILFEYGFFNSVILDFDMRSPVTPPSTPSSFRRDIQRAPHQCGVGRSIQDQLDRAVVGMFFETHKSVVPDYIIGRHFTDVVMHEVGHTLGLRHNFAGSALISRADLADKSFTSTHGISTSVMDYIGVNAFSDLTPKAAMHHDFYNPVVGSYDMAAIAYGYSQVKGEMPGYKHKKLSEIARAAPMFLTDEDADMGTNPYAQRHDISSDPVDYANDRLQLVKLFRNNSLYNRVQEDASWANLWFYESRLLRLLNASIDKAQPFIGGVNATHAHRLPGETAFSVPPIPKTTQLRALNVLARVIRAENGLFPSPEQYSSYVNVVGYNSEDCEAPSLNFGCLARVLVDIDDAIKSVRIHAVYSALFPAMDLIISQDVNSPLSIREVLSTVEDAAYFNTNVPRNRVVYAYYRDLLRQIVKDTSQDVRVRREVFVFLNATAAHELT